MAILAIVSFVITLVLLRTGTKNDAIGLRYKESAKEKFINSLLLSYKMKVSEVNVNDDYLNHTQRAFKRMANDLGCNVNLVN